MKMDMQYASTIRKRFAKRAQNAERARLNRAPTVACFVDGDAICKKLDVFVFQVETLAEALHTASSVQKALLPRVEGMAL
jgi:hypothetical protein